jgi:hypothetical protein
MKTGCVLTFCIFLVACGAICLYVLSLNRPESLDTDPHVIPTPEPEPDPDKYLSYVKSLNEFKKAETGDAYRVSYGFIDYIGKSHHISCNIKKSDYLSETDSYGYDDKLFDKLSAQELSDFFNREVKKLGLDPYITLTFPGGGRYRWEYSIPSATAEWQDEKEREIKQYFSTFRERVKERYHVVMNRMLAERGFQMNDYLITINYRNLVLKGQQPLMDCFENLKNNAKNYNEKQYLGMFLAFFQEITYQVPPDIINGRHTIGLWVPTEVVSNNHGDCDSKSVAFSAMIKSLGLSSIVIHVPKHALVGVEAKPGPDQEFVRIGNRYFILCEVAGPGKWAPGNKGGDDIKGSFEYQLIEPNDTI